MEIGKESEKAAGRSPRVKPMMEIGMKPSKPTGDRQEKERKEVPTEKAGERNNHKEVEAIER
jgi:hypothetical protein